MTRRQNALLAALLASAGGNVMADTFQWNLPSNGSWTEAANWLGGIAPPAGGAVGTELIFGSPATTNYTSTNNLGGAFTLSRLVFDNDSRALINVTSASGSGMVLDGPTPQINITGLGSLTLANATGGLGLSLATNVAVNVSSLGGSRITAPISGPGGITVTGTELSSNTGNFHISSGAGNNTFLGGVTLNSGNLTVEGTVATATPLGSGPLTVNGGYVGFNGTLSRISGAMIVNSDLRFSKGNGTVNGPITVNDATAELQIFGGGITINVPAAFTGATILGGRGDYAASTGPATLTLGNNAATNGTLLNTPSISLLDGATLALENTAATGNVPDRVNDAATIHLDSGNISLRANPNGTAETLGATTVAGYATIESRPGSAAPFAEGELRLTSLDRSDRGVLFVRGQNLGLPTATPPPTTATRHATIKVTGAAPALVGGGGADGTTNISIVPWTVANYSTTSSTGASANTFATYGPNGFRPLNPATEYASSLAAGADQNVAISATTNNDAAVTVNSLLLATGNITGTGSVAVTSGAILNNANATISNALSFGSVEAIITNHNPLVVDGNLTGTNGLTKSGSWPLVLNGDNSGLTGPLTINGTDRVDITSEASLPGTGPIIVHSGASTAAAGIGAGSIDGQAHSLTISRPIVMKSGLGALDTRQSQIEVTFSGDISGDGGVIINSGASFGVVELTGNNTYKGITRVHSGVLKIHSDANLGDGGAVVLTTASPALGMELAGDWTTSRTVHMLSVSGLQTNQYNAVFNGPMTGTSELRKFGTGALVLNADSPYTGTIAVQDGALIVNGHVPATIQAQGASPAEPVILGGAGRAGDVSVLGIVAPGADGASAGVFSASSMTLFGSSLLAFDLGPGGDLVQIDNALVRNTNSGTEFPFLFNVLPGLTVGETYDLFHFGGTSFLASDFSFIGPAGLEGVFNLTANALQFQVTAVPEPTGLLLAAAAPTLLARRRRQTI